MNVQILQLLEGARAARGLTVIIDVFRAFSLEAYLFDAGACKILPVGEEAVARRIKEENPDFILAGERDGKILPGFDTGNSPSLLSEINARGKTVIHTTSAGTQGIANAIFADEILGASLVNARATAEYVRRSGAREVSLVCMGLAAKRPTDEDTLCARYIKSILEGTALDMAAEIESLKLTDGAKFFDDSQSDVFPREDFFLCTDLDRFDFAMKLEGKHMVRKDIL